VLIFSLADEIRQLRGESEWREGDRNSMTLAKALDFRVLLSVLREGATIHDDEGDGRASVQVLEGRAVLKVDNQQADLVAGELATVDTGHRWQLRAKEESAVLLTIAWPREKAGV
jgi:quercetin dioxygenase-like cupin family protein